MPEAKKMSAVEEGTLTPTTCQRSGRYQYRYWHVNLRGDRCAFSHPPIGREASPPDLINTAYRNADGSRTVYGLAFDFDAHRAERRWLDDGGRLDWPRIGAYLAEAHSPIFQEIAHVARSTSGKGLGLVLAINPLPVRKSTECNQRVLYNLQSRLIAFFEALGLGADPGARGLERDLPNFRDPERSVHENSLAFRRAERSVEGVASKLHAYLNSVAAAEKREARLYNDARAETGIGRLVAWLLGSYDPGCGVWVPSFLSGETSYVSTKTLLAITGLSAPFLRGFLKSPPAWLEATYLGRDEGWRLCVPLGRAVQRLLPRAETLLAAADKAGLASTSPRKVLFSIAAINEPHLVRHGEHNAWVTALALAYKWHGYSYEEALAKIQLRSEVLPERETSVTCREFRSIVRSIYKNVPQTFGRFAGRDLPNWIKDDTLFVFGKKISPRGGAAPDGLRLLGVVGQESAATSPKVANILRPPLIRLRRDVDEAYIVGLSCGLGESLAPQEMPPIIGELPDGTSPFRLGDSSVFSSVLTAIRWRQRVGIFDGERLVLCLTKRHYRAAAAVELLKKRPEYQGANLRLHTPHKERQASYHPSIDACTHVLCSADALGHRRTYAEKIAQWEQAKGFQTVVVSDAHALEPPF